MKRIALALILLLTMSTQAFALDKVLGASNTFLVWTLGLDSKSSPHTGLIFNTDFVVKIQCANATATQVDGTGDTPVHQGQGLWIITANDSITSNAEEECKAWTEGTGTYAGYVAYTPMPFKAVSGKSAYVGATCQITAASSGTSFTIGTCTDHANKAITLATDSFVGTYAVAYNRAATQCNVVGEGVFINDLTAGVVTVKEADMPGSGFSATPNTTNCNVEIRP